MNALPRFIDELKGGTDGGKEMAARALSNLISGTAEHKEHKNAIVAAGAIEPLVALLKSGSGCGKKYAARALANLACCTAEHRAAIVAASAIEH